MTTPTKKKRTPQDFVRRYRKRGWWPIPIKKDTKRPPMKEWQDLRVDKSDVTQLWKNGAGVGIILGASGLADVDLDCAEAVELASEFLPPTEGVFGRRSARQSHHIYKVDTPSKTKKFHDTERSTKGKKITLVELRCDGAQTLFPPTKHPSGERIAWADGDRPSKADYDDLAECVRRLAAATLLARHWPEGGRHDAALALGGALARADWERADIEHFVAAVTKAAGDEERGDRQRAVRDTAKKVKSGEQVTGLPTLASIFGEDAVGKLKTWLGLGDASSGLSAHTALIAHPPNTDALHGLAGEIVRTIEPQTEADPWALLVTILVAFGNAVGANAHMLIGATRHPARLNVVIVGDSAKARKGVSLDEVMRLFRAAAPDWEADHTASGLSSGEGLIYQVRDAVEVWDQKKQAFATVDPGVQDKRLFVVESELGRTLTVMSREGSILSQLVRQAWDHGNLRNMSRATNFRASEAHISVLGHVTVVELKNKLADVEAWNGFANRFIWIGAKRSKLLPRGGNVPEKAMARLSKKLRAALRFAGGVDELDFDEDGGRAWDAVYEELADPLPGLAGAMTARAEPQVLRLAMIYALFDKTDAIGVAHVRAALAVWRYAEATARAITGDASGDPLADRLFEAVRDGARARNELRNEFGRHVLAADMDRALALNERLGRMRKKVKEKTGGRSRTVWERVTADPRAKSAESAVSPVSVDGDDLVIPPNVDDGDLMIPFGDAPPIQKVPRELR